VKVLLAPFLAEPTPSIKLLVENTSIFPGIHGLMRNQNSALSNKTSPSECSSSPVAHLTALPIIAMLYGSFFKVGVVYES